MKPLPEYKLDAFKLMKVKVTKGSTVNINGNVYSVHSRLIGSNVDARIYSNHIEIWYAQKKAEDLPRLFGKEKHKIEYRHIINNLVKKPGAFENYKYKEDLFPTSRFRIAFDILQQQHTVNKANKIYINILSLAAKENETEIDNILATLIEKKLPINIDAIKNILNQKQIIYFDYKNIVIPEVKLTDYNTLLSCNEEVVLS